MRMPGFDAEKSFYPEVNRYLTIRHGQLAKGANVIEESGPGDCWLQCDLCVLSTFPPSCLACMVCGLTVSGLVHR